MKKYFLVCFCFLDRDNIYVAKLASAGSSIFNELKNILLKTKKTDTNINEIEKEDYQKALEIGYPDLESQKK